MSELTLRAVRPEDGPAIRRLLSAVFTDNPKQREDVMTWQYWSNPFGDAVGLVWERAGEVVCHLSSIPVPMQIGGRPALGAIRVDGAMTAELRGQGKYAELVHRLNDACAAHGIEASVSFLSTTMRPGPDLPRAVERLRLFARPVGRGTWAVALGVPRPISSLVRRAFRTPRPGGTRCDGVPADVDALWDEVAPTVSCGVVRSAEWWRWRYAGHPDTPYRFFEVRDGGRLRAAAAAVRRTFRGLEVVQLLELLAADGRDVRGLLGTVAADDPEVEAILAVGSAASAWAGVVRSGGLRLVPDRLDPNPLNVNVWRLSPEAVAVHAGPWTVSWGDFDHL